MDIIHRLNPFHHRPPSSLRHHSNTPTSSLQVDHFASSTAPEKQSTKTNATLNVPHHARPSSSLEDPFPSVSVLSSRYDGDRDQARTPTGTYTSNPSIDSTMPSLYMEPSDERYLARTPIRTHTHPFDATSPVPNNGHGLKGHKRAPSILRSLAHHPSLSALKNRSKRKKRKEVPTSPLPNQPTYTQDEGGSVGGTLRKKSLKASKSVPRDMRLSTGSEDEPLPPLPTSSATLAAYQARSLSVSQSSTTRNGVISHSALPKRTTSIRRKPAPSPSPDLFLAKQSHIKAVRRLGSGLDSRTSGEEVQTPESVRFRMRFELDCMDDFQAENHRRNNLMDVHAESRIVGGEKAYGLGVGSPGRRRYMSFDESSSARYTEQRAGRHLSTPANDGSPSRSPANDREPGHTELYAQSLHADSTTFFSSHMTPARQLQIQQQELHHHYPAPDIGEDDGFGMFVKKAEVPPGTPGGRKEDLQRGAFVDGAKHEPNAVRFFSRDMYAPPSATPSPSSSEHHARPEAKHLSPTKSVKSPHRRAESTQYTPTRSPNHRRAESSPAASPIRLRKQAFDKAAKRSSSPFEVKLAPSVTKRMSLDAFGTPTPPRSDDDHGPDRDAFEEVLENVWEDQMSHTATGVEVELGDDLSFDEEHEEIAGSEGEQLDDGGLEAHRSHHLSTIDETPSSQELSAADIPIYITPDVEAKPTPPGTRYFTPMPPLLDDRGLPTPRSYSPSPLTRRFLSAPPLSITPSLLQARSDHTQALKDQLKASEVVIDVLRGEIDELRNRVEIKKEARRCVAERMKEQESLAEELAIRCDGKEAALDQLRQAMAENEEFFDDLQEAHDALAEQCASLNQDKAELSTARQGTAAALDGMRSELDKVKEVLANKQTELTEVEDSKKELEGVVFELRRELKWAESQVAEKEEQVSQERLRGSEVKAECVRVAKELKAANEKIKAKDVEIAQVQEKKAFLVARYQGQIGALELDLKTSNEKKEAELLELKEGFEAERKKMDEEHQRSIDLQSASKEKDEIITYLRELLASEQSTSRNVQKASAGLFAQLATLEHKLTAADEQLQAANLSLVNKDATIDAFNERLSLARYERNEKHFEAEVELNQLRERMEEVTRDSAEREWAAREGREMMARLMEEKRVWEEEREELVDMLNRDSADENSLSNLRSRIDSLTDQASASTRQIHHLQAELEDSRSALEHKSTLIHAQEAELSALRLTLAHLEDNMTAAKEVHDRQLKDSERVIGRLRSQVEELELQISLHEGALKNALTESYSTKANSEDHIKRIQGYLVEIDRLKLSEIKLKAQLDEVQRSSASDGIKLVELEKKVKALEEDKELLNVALESKTLELTLLQRQTDSRSSRVPATPLAGSISRSARPTSFSTTRSATVAGTPSTMSKSTSRIPATPTPISGVDSTPLPRRLATSTSSTIRARRGTVTGAPTGVVGTSTGTTPLGVSTAHNKAPAQARTPINGGITAGSTSKSRCSIKIISSKTDQGAPASTIEPKSDNDMSSLTAAVKVSTNGAQKMVERRSSLPVLRRSTSGGRPNSALGASMASRRESLISIDEDR
ncbi:hypothetical protein IAU59_000516 [Kwoniella sp. CBS 9459]